MIRIWTYIHWDIQQIRESPLFMVVYVPTSTIFNHVRILSYFTSYSLWKYHQLSQMNKWPNVIFLKVTLRHPILSFVTWFMFSVYLWISLISSQYKYICENICLFHNGSVSGLYISLVYPYIYLKSLCENCSFFHYFPKIPKQIEKKHNFEFFKKIFFCVF